MKKNIILLAIFSSSFIFAQTIIPLENGDIEDTGAMYQNKRNGKKWSIKGIWFNENSKPSKFNVANSGLAIGEGVEGSQAIKSTVVDGEGKTAQVTLVLGRIDISAYGPGTYKFDFKVKSKETTPQRPFWLVVNADDSRKKNITKEAISTVDNGGTVSFRGLENVYSRQSITVKVSGDDTKYLLLQVQHGRFSNTYWFDNFTLTKLD
ncbi:hypothetical protein [Polaribacter sp.]|uniref:hypothetical protein n=1 Tax=Polaribacter sp. TaxID=1920175 RepID=UPI003F6BEBD6